MGWFKAVLLVATSVMLERCVTPEVAKKPVQVDTTTDLARIDIGELGLPGYSYYILRLVSLSDASYNAKPQTFPTGGGKAQLKVVPGKYRVILDYYSHDKVVVYSAEYCKSDVKNNEMAFAPGVNATATIHICAKETTEQNSADQPAVAMVTLTATLTAGSSEASAARASSSLGFDEIYGHKVDRTTSYYSDHGHIYFGGKELMLHGVNWSGFDTPNQIVHGLWTGRTIDSYLTQMRQLGFNTLRLPIAPETMLPATKTLGEIHTMKLKVSALKNLADLITMAGEKDMYVLLDLHTCSKNAGGLTGRPDAEVCAGYTRDSWVETLRKMAFFSKSHRNIIGIDLYNEPSSLSWRDWREYADFGGKQVLTINPQLLVFVEGVGRVGVKPNDTVLDSGGNIMGAEELPVDLPAARLVYAPHTYGPDVAAQSFFSAAAGFPDNLPEIWDANFGYLTSSGSLPVIGQFGGKYQSAADKKWQDAFVAYLIKKNFVSFFYASFDPNSGETGGLLLDDWKSINQDKLTSLKPLMH